MTDDDTDPIELLYREQGARLWRALLAWSGDREIASDAVSEAFMQLIAKGAAVRDPQAGVWRAAFPPAPLRPLLDPGSSGHHRFNTSGS